MTSHRGRYGAATTVSLAALASTAILVACTVELPTSDELKELDVARVEELAADASVLTEGDAETIYTLDGMVVTREVAHAVDPAEVTAVAVTRASDGSPARMEITSRGGSAPPDEVLQSALLEMPEPAVVEGSRTPPDPFGPPPTPGGPRTAVEPGHGSRMVVYLVDGVRTDVPDNAPVVEGHPMYGIAGSDIEQIAVLMCEQATRIVPEAVDGLVVVRTRNGPADGIVLPASRHLRGVNSGTLRPRRCGESLSRASVDAALNGAGMLVVDGFRATREEALSIPASAIFSISLPQRNVTPAQLVEQYGPDAADGVAVVATKAGDWRPGSGIAP